MIQSQPAVRSGLLREIFADHLIYLTTAVYLRRAPRTNQITQVAVDLQAWSVSLVMSVHAKQLRLIYRVSKVINLHGCS